jgi:hypothetical protein
MDANTELTLNGTERELLVDILTDRLGTLREEVYHSTVSSFKDQLKEREVVLRGILERLGAPAG